MSFEKRIGKPISDELSRYLKKNITKQDRATIAGNVGTSPSTIRDLIYQNALVTDKNSEYLIEAARVAMKNCRENIHDYRVAEEYLDKELEMAANEKVG